MIRVVLMDDRAVVQAGLHVLLEEYDDIVVAGGIADGREVVTVAAREHPDVVYMDLRISAEDGLTAIRQIVASHQGRSPAVPVITAFDLDVDTFGALKARADGFILKDCEPGGLVDTVRHLAAGYELVDYAVTRRMIAEFIHCHAPAGNTTKIQKLTAREPEIVRLLAADMLNAEIAAKLVVKTNTVKSHPTRILPEVDARDRMRVVAWTHRNSLAG